MPEWDEMDEWREEQRRDWGEYLAALHEKAMWERLAPGNDDDLEAAILAARKEAEDA